MNKPVERIFIKTGKEKPNMRGTGRKAVKMAAP